MHEAGCTKKFAQAQETREAPCLEKVHSGEEIKGGGSAKIEDREGIVAQLSKRDMHRSGNHFDVSGIAETWKRRVFQAVLRSVMLAVTEDCKN